MVRRSFRFGLRLGLLGGAGFAVLKVLQARREEREQEAALRSTEPWPPITRAPAPPTGEAVETAPRTTAAAPPAEEAEPEEPPVLAEPPEPADAALSSIEAPTTAPPPAEVRPDGPPRPDAKKAPATKGAAAPKTTPEPWVDPEGRVCPPSHPIKGKLKSRLFHAPGMFAYDRTIPDRCYGSEEAAAADGLSRARR